MTTSKREAILAAVEAALAGTTDVGTRIYRSRPEAFSRGEMPALIIEPATETAVDPEGTGGVSSCRLDWRLIIRIGVITRGPIPDQLADPILLSIHQRLMTNANLAALIMSIYPQATTWEQSDGDGTAGAAICNWMVRYRTSVNDITI